MTPSDAATLEIVFEGEPLQAREGETIAAALLRNGVEIFSRSPKYHRPRGPFCLAGVCGQCLMRVDGEPNRPVCTIPARDGHVVERQNALGSADHDLLRAVDYLYPTGLDHHHLMIRFKSLNAAAQATAWRLAGTGRLPDVPRPPQAALMEARSVVIVGGGRAGLAAARGAAQEGVRPLMVEAAPRLGGRSALAPAVEEIEQIAEAWTRSVAGGLYEEGGQRVLVVRAPDGLRQVRLESLVLSTGGYERPLVFENNDLPGIFGGRGLARLMKTDVLPGRHEAVVFGTGADLEPVTRALIAAGLNIAAVIDPEDRCRTITKLPVIPGARVSRAHGGRRLHGVTVRFDDREEDLRCDVLALIAPLSPAYELAGEVGASVSYHPESGGFTLNVDADARTSVPWLFAAGRVAGGGSRAGEIAGRAAARAVRRR